MKRNIIKSMFCMGITGVTVLSMITGDVTTKETYADTRDTQEISIDETTFPDPVFRQWVLDTYDTDSNSELSATERLQVESTGNINAFSNSNMVKDWAGIEYFTGLTDFHVPGNNSQMTTLDLSKNQNLTTILINGSSNLTTLNVSGLSSLKTLECAFASISELDISSLSNLERLACPNTSVKELDVNGLSNLQVLVCYDTPIKELNVSGLNNLVAIMCSNTSVAELDLTGLNNLQGLICANTPISELNVSGLSNLTQIECNNTLITELDLTNLTKLTTLSCNNCQLTALDLSHNSLCTNLNISNQRVSAPLYYDGDNYYVDATEFSNLDKTKVEAISNLGSSYNYNSSKGWLECQGALNPGDELYYTYDTGTSVKMQVVVEISKVVDLTASDTEATTEAPTTTETSTATTETTTVTTENTVSTSEEATTAAPTELPAASTNASNETAEDSANNVQKQNTPRTGDAAILIWISILGIFAAASFILTGRKKP